MNKDLRTFLKYLEQKRPDLLVRVKKEVRPKFEIQVIQEKLAKRGQYPAVFCEKVEGSRMPIVSNLFGSYEMLGLAIGVEDKDFSKILQTYMTNEVRRTPVKYVDAKAAPVRDVRLSPVVSHFLSAGRPDDEMRQFLAAAVGYLTAASAGMVEVPTNVVRALKEVERIAEIEDQALKPEQQDQLRFYLLQIARLASDNG